jgi:hypothetical protein
LALLLVQLAFDIIVSVPSRIVSFTPKTTVLIVSTSDGGGYNFWLLPQYEHLSPQKFYISLLPQLHNQCLDFSNLIGFSDEKLKMFSHVKAGIIRNDFKGKTP